MKKLILLSLVASLSLMASEICALSGEVVLGGGVIKDDDRLIRHGGNDKDFDESMAFPLIKSRLSIGNFELSVGVKELLRGLYRINDDWSMYAGYHQQKTWKNPFLNGTAREKTDMDTFFAGMNYQALDWLAVGYKFQNHEVDNETVHTDDRRSGNRHSLSASMAYSLSNTLALSVKLENALGRFEGKGNDYFATGLTSSLQWKMLEHTTLESEMFYTYYNYSHNMNQFDKERDEKRYGVSLKLTQEQLFGYKNVFGFVMASHTKRESNIDFYDASTSVAALGLGYRFSRIALSVVYFTMTQQFYA